MLSSLLHKLLVFSVLLAFTSGQEGVESREPEEDSLIVVTDAEGGVWKHDAASQACSHGEGGCSTAPSNDKRLPSPAASSFPTTLSAKEDQGIYTKRSLQGISFPSPPSGVTYAFPRKAVFEVDTSSLEDKLSYNPEQLSLVKSTLIPLAINHLSNVVRSNRNMLLKFLPRKCDETEDEVVDGNGKVWRNVCTQPKPTTICGRIPVRTEYLQSLDTCDITQDPPVCQTLPAGTGYTADLLLMFSHEKTTSSARTCKDGYDAAYYTCEFHNRIPAIALITLCQGSILYSPVSQQFLNLQASVSILKHEILHAMGHNPKIAGLYTDDKGVNRTPTEERTPNGYPLPFYASSALVFEFDSAYSRGFLKTPSLVEKSKEYFKCPSLTKFETENDGLSLTRWSHYEMGLAFDDIMTGNAKDGHITALTVALLEDSGWWMPDYAEVGEGVWGNGKFSEDGNCYMLKINDQGASAALTASPTSPYCNQPKIEEICSYDLLSYTSCDTVRFIKHRARVGGRNCNDNTGSGGEGQIFGATSRCFRSKPKKNNIPTTKLEASCYQRDCHFTQRDANNDPIWDSITISAAGDATKIRCESNEEGHEKSFGTTGSIVCPNIALSCHGAPCNNGGYLKHGRCICDSAYTGVTCDEVATASNRTLHHDGWGYSINRLTLWVGRKYEINHDITSITDIKSGYDFTILHGELPKGLYLNHQTGVVFGVPWEVTSSCSPFTIQAWNDKGQGSSTLLWLHVIDDESKLPTTPKAPCHTYSSGDQPSERELQFARYRRTVLPSDYDLRGYPKDAVAALYRSIRTTIPPLGVVSDYCTGSNRYLDSNKMGWVGMTQVRCESLGYCYDAAANIPGRACFTPQATAESCKMPVARRQSAFWTNITQADCLLLGACYDPDANSCYWARIPAKFVPENRLLRGQMYHTSRHAAPA